MAMPVVCYDEARRSVTFRYRDAQAQTAYRTLPLVEFLWSVLQHVLPCALCRVRHYGFLHGKAKLRLAQVRLLLHVIIAARLELPRPWLCCPCCRCSVYVIAGSPPRQPPPDD